MGIFFSFDVTTMFIFLLIGKFRKSTDCDNECNVFDESKCLNREGQEERKRKKTTMKE